MLLALTQAKVWKLLFFCSPIPAPPQAAVPVSSGPNWLGTSMTVLWLGSGLMYHQWAILTKKGLTISSMGHYTFKADPQLYQSPCIWTPPILASKFSKPGFSNMWTVNFQMFKLVLEKAEEPEIKLPTSSGSWKKQESSRKKHLFLLEPLTVWITINCGKFWKRWEYQTTWPAS